MRIGIDIDGILADFYSPYEKLHIQVAGDRFGSQRFPEVWPQIWDWPSLFGYTEEDTSAVWQLILADPDFWMDLGTLPDFNALSFELMHHNEVYFITDRRGVSPKRQTECWFASRGWIPTVLVSAQKGLCCKALKLDLYIDDKGENIQAVEAESPDTRAYLLDRPYNQAFAPKLLGYTLLGILQDEGVVEQGHN